MRRSYGKRTGEKVHRSHEGVQVAVDNSREHLGVAGIVKEGLVYPKEAHWVRRMMRMGGQAAVRMGWEDLEVVHSCQQTDLDNHYSGDVQDSYLLILAAEIQSCGSIISILM
jgi:hypothetical protein